MPVLTFADVAEGVRATIAAYTQALDDGRTDDVVATFCPDGGCDIPGLGTHRGHDAWRSWMSSRREGLNRAHFEVAELIELAPDRALLVAHMRGTGRSSGLEIGALGASVVVLRDGKITRVTLYQSKAEALAALGLQ